MYKKSTLNFKDRYVLVFVKISYYHKNMPYISCWSEPISWKSKNSNIVTSYGCMSVLAKLIRGSCMVWEINMGVCPRLDFENIMWFNCLGYNFNIYGAFVFLCNSIANLWRHEWYHYNTLGYLVIIIS